MRDLIVIAPALFGAHERVWQVLRLVRGDPHSDISWLERGIGRETAWDIEIGSAVAQATMRLPEENTLGGSDIKRNVTDT